MSLAGHWDDEALPASAPPVAPLPFEDEQAATSAATPDIPTNDRRMAFSS
jgi:hypothetical protein